jgi:hypothetical protein
LFVRHTPNEAGEISPARLGTNAKDVFKRIEEHLLIVSRAAALLVDAGTCPVIRSAFITSQRSSELTTPTRNERETLLRRKRGVKLLVVASALLIALGLGSIAGWTLYDCMIQSDELSGRAPVSALVERLIAVESNGDPNAKNSRSSALGLGQFLDETWLDLVRSYRPDLTRGRSAIQTLELRREPKLAREIITRFVVRNIVILRQRRLPVTAGTVYLAHFAGAAGAVAILSAPDNSDAALVLASADSTGRTKRERLIKANTFLEHFTVADLKAWADRKMGGPNLHLVEELMAETRP